ncbi:UxaA family hydrolase [Thermus sediminis]|uniref:UxaA family hydrolase n=1 Tax=Thermus sediminis TaxID=1761908 RepID=UPI0022B800B0|nr:UxaA family hydrolase [Thermus sediminis]
MWPPSSQGSLPCPTPTAACSFGDDLELTFRTLAGHGANPNVFGAVVIGIEPKWTERVAEDIARTGKTGGGLRHRGLRGSQDGGSGPPAPPTAS